MGTRIDAAARSSARFVQNREANLASLAALEKALADARAGGGERYVQRHKERGKLLPRERIELLALDRRGQLDWRLEILDGISSWIQIRSLIDPR
jgi:acetyl-CoA carboxylase carboxyltransferase component